MVPAILKKAISYFVIILFSEFYDVKNFSCKYLGTKKRSIAHKNDEIMKI